MYLSKYDRPVYRRGRVSLLLRGNSLFPAQLEKHTRQIISPGRLIYDLSLAPK